MYVFIVVIVVGECSIEVVFVVEVLCCVVCQCGFDLMIEICSDQGVIGVLFVVNVVVIVYLLLVGDGEVDIVCFGNVCIVYVSLGEVLDDLVVVFVLLVVVLVSDYDIDVGKCIVVVIFCFIGIVYIFMVVEGL